MSEIAPETPPRTRTVEIDHHAINFGPQHPAAHGVLRLDPRDGRRGGRARRSAYRPPPSRHREADRAQDLHPGRPVFRPARLRLADVPGARLRARDREAARDRGAGAGPVYPHALRRDHPHPEPSPQRDHLRARCRRADAEPLGVRGAREAARVPRGGLGRPAARELFSPGRRASRTCRPGLRRISRPGPRHFRNSSTMSRSC